MIAPNDPVSSNEVYHSPEFKAFCKRFGIAYELPTMDITIVLPLRGLMTITQTYRAQDVPQTVVSTTVQQNKQYETYKPVE